MKNSVKNAEFKLHENDIMLLILCTHLAIINVCMYTFVAYLVNATS